MYNPDSDKPTAAAERLIESCDGADGTLWSPMYQGRGVSGTPIFFINGRRQYGAYDIGTLFAAVRAAGTRARSLRP
jgi:hypothetical protein